ncbi:MAG TPA: hypothetical protein VNO30_34290 [Kofleriaceae bacterium]|nr:hypothetical protein [Kofleriaceae bacterium]
MKLTIDPSAPSNASNAASTHTPDPRPHVAALLELASLGWRVTEIRPDRALWRVTVTRYDGDATIGVTNIDPDAALDETLRYASVDDEPTYEVAPASERTAGSEHAAPPEEP